MNLSDIFPLFRGAWPAVRDDGIKLLVRPAVRDDGGGVESREPKSARGARSAAGWLDARGHASAPTRASLRRKRLLTG